VGIQDVAFVGNDVNDCGIMGKVGFRIAVSDAHPEVRGMADLVLSKRGGQGAVRELCDQILAQNLGEDHDSYSQNW
jgi:N-acylneuraminate cytidylyltransferase